MLPMIVNDNFGQIPCSFGIISSYTKIVTVYFSIYEIFDIKYLLYENIIHQSIFICFNAVYDDPRYILQRGNSVDPHSIYLKILAKKKKSKNIITLKR